MCAEQCCVIRVLDLTYWDKNFVIRGPNWKFVIDYIGLGKLGLLGICVIYSLVVTLWCSRLIELKDNSTLVPYKFLTQSMIVLHPFAFIPSCTTITCSKPFSHDNHFVPSPMALRIVPNNARKRTFLCSASSQPKDLNGMDFNLDVIKEDLELRGDGEGAFLGQGLNATSDEKNIVEEAAQDGEDDDAGYSDRGSYTGRPEKDYDKDPELGTILGSFLENPQEAQSQVSITVLMVWQLQPCIVDFIFLWWWWGGGVFFFYVWCLLHLLLLKN